MTRFVNIGKIDNIWVNFDHVTEIRDDTEDGGGSILYLENGRFLRVNTTPEEILNALGQAYVSNGVA